MTGPIGGGGKPPVSPEQDSEQSSKKSSQKDSATSSSSTSSSSTATNSTSVPAETSAPRASNNENFRISDLPDLALKRLIDYMAATQQGAKAVSEVNRDVYLRSRHGIGAEKHAQIPTPLPEHKDDPSLSVDQNLEATKAQKASVKAFTDKINDLRDPRYTFRLPIVTGFIANIALFLEKEFDISPGQFHSIMGRKYILKRPGNKPENDLTTPEMNFAFNLDYAKHIVKALNLGNIDGKNTTEIVDLLLNLDLTTMEKEEIQNNYKEQFSAVNEIYDCVDNEKKKFLLRTKTLIDRVFLYAIPPHIAELKHVTDVTIRGHKFTTLPPEIGELEQLKMLNLLGIKLKTLPSEIGKLENLERLYVYFSEAEASPLPESLKNLKKLTTLFIDEALASSKDPQTQSVLEFLRTKNPPCEIGD